MSWSFFANIKKSIERAKEKEKALAKEHARAKEEARALVLAQKLAKAPPVPNKPKIVVPPPPPPPWSMNINAGDEFQAVPPLPPHRVNADTNTLSVGNVVPKLSILMGKYVAKSSSESIVRGSSLRAIMAFDNNNKTLWRTAGCCGSGYQRDPYNWGKYIGGGKADNYFKTATITGQQIEGEWIEIKLPYKLQATRYTLLTATDCCPRRFPTKFTLLGSNDGRDWTVLDKRDIDVNPQGKYNVNVPVKFNISTVVQLFNTFRIVFEGSSYEKDNNVMAISGIQIYGLYPTINISGQVENKNTPRNTNNIRPYNNKSIMKKKEGFSPTMQSEEQLINDLNDFNAKYATYVNCKTNTPTACTQQETILKSAYDKIVTFGNNNTVSGGSLYGVSSSLANVNDIVTNTVADASFNDIKTKHKHITQMRSELDAKLKELYVTDDSLAYEQQRIFDGTIYTSLIWTVLATTTLFYVFKKI